jgi:hypothetical protein
LPNQTKTARKNARKRFVSTRCIVLQFVAASICASCSIFQLAAVPRRSLTRTFNP